MRHQLTRNYLIFIVITLAIAVLFISGCGKKEASPTNTTSAPTTTGAQYTIDVANKQGIGDYLVDSARMTLYRYTGDNFNKSNVSQDLIQDWPIFSVSKYNVPSKLKSSDFSNTISGYGSGGSNSQTCYKGWPLYYSDLDKKPGDTFGNVKNGFLVISPDSTSAPQG